MPPAVARAPKQENSPPSGEERSRREREGDVPVGMRPR
jgi:hypothetical protein